MATTSDEVCNSQRRKTQTNEVSYIVWVKLRNKSPGIMLIDLFSGEVSLGNAAN